MLRIYFLYLTLVHAFHFENNSSQGSRISQLFQVDRVHTALLYGDVELGYYYVNIYIGTPPVRQTVIIDTGSAITTFPCNDCGSLCGNHFDSQFDQKASTTAQTVQCHELIGRNSCQKCDNQNRCSFTISYTEKSELTGYFIRDFILFGDALYELYQLVPKVDQSIENDFKNLVDFERFKTVFGCTLRETNQFRIQQADGIMGLSPKANSQYALPNVIDDLFYSEDAKGEALQFSICLGIKGGYISLGGYDKHRLPTNAQTYKVRYEQDANTYRININKVKIGEYELGVEQFEFDKGFGSFIDSGTTLVYADDKIYNEFMKTFHWYCQNNPTHCPNMRQIEEQICFKYDEATYHSFEEFSKLFPTIDFKLDNNFNFDWRPQDYLYKETYMTSEQNIYCFPVNKYPISDRFMLGTVWMRNWDILFDRQGKTISFTRTECSTEKVHFNAFDHQSPPAANDFKIGLEPIPLKTESIPKTEQVEIEKGESLGGEEEEPKSEESSRQETEEEEYFEEQVDEKANQNITSSDQTQIINVNETTKNKTSEQEGIVGLNENKVDLPENKTQQSLVNEEEQEEEQQAEGEQKIIEKQNSKDEQKAKDKQENEEQLVKQQKVKEKEEVKKEEEQSQEIKSEEEEESTNDFKEMEIDLLEEQIKQFKKWMTLLAFIIGVLIIVVLLMVFKMCYKQAINTLNDVVDLSKNPGVKVIQSNNEESDSLHEEKKLISIQKELEDLEQHEEQIIDEDV